MPIPSLRRRLLLMLGLALGAGVSSLQAAGPSLQLTGWKLSPLTVNSGDLVKMPRRSLEATDKDGKKHVYEGVALPGILQRAGAPLGAALYGEALRLCVPARARDGYATVFSLAELDPALTDKVGLLADRCDGSPLGDTDGPLRLVVPDEKRRVRWERQLESLELIRAGE